VLNVKPGEAAMLCIPAEGDHVAVIGTSRKLLVFPLSEVPELSRGSGVLLQKYREGKLADAKVFRLADGLAWRLGDKMRTESRLQDWIGARGQAGRMPPTGFPKTGRFS
jgi:topoisomerase-4 subunit A